MKKASWIGITTTDEKLSTYALMNLNTGVTISAGRPTPNDRYMIIWQNTPGSLGAVTEQPIKKSAKKGSAPVAQAPPAPPRNILIVKMLSEDKMYIFMLELASQLEVGYNEWFQEFTEAVEREPAN